MEDIHTNSILDILPLLAPTKDTLSLSYFWRSKNVDFVLVSVTSIHYPRTNLVPDFFPCSKYVIGGIMLFFGPLLLVLGVFLLCLHFEVSTFSTMRT